MAPEQAGSTRFIDSHAHLADTAFAGDRDDVVGRAREAGAAAIVCIGSALEDGAARSVADKYPGYIHWTAGIHPHEAASFDASRDIEVLRLSAADGAVAIGECGLDYHYDNSPRDVQRAVLEHQIALAAEVGLPLIVHTRDAEDDTMAMVVAAAATGVKGVLHCFTGSADLAETAVHAGWYISFSGIITFRKWAGEDIVRQIPDDRLLAESDSPYLAPVPFRGKRNEPAWVGWTVRRLAEVRGITPGAMGDSVARNAENLFGLASRAAA